MEGISNEIKIRIGIKRGCVYNFSPSTGIDNHYFIVLNSNPKKDEEIHLAMFTTKKENVLKFIEYRKLDSKTLVQIERGECPFLPRPDDTGVDCNRPISINIEDLIERINDSEGSCSYPAIPENLISRIIEGVRASRMVGENIKQAL